MPKTKISEFSATPGNNTDIDGINIAEGCAPSGINDAIRELMSQLKDFQAGTAGDSFNGPVGTTTAAAGAFTTLSASGAVTLSGGTANGVPYLNGSKVLTTGSALTFDGTNFATTGNVTGAALRSIRASGSQPEFVLTQTGVASWSIYNPPSSTDLRFYNGSDLLTMTSAGNLGLGVTPSAWGGSSKILQISNAAFRGAGNSAYVGANYYFDGSNNRYIASAAASLYEQDAGRHIFYTAPSGTAGNAISFTQAMTLDASGRLAIGVTGASSNVRLAVSGAIKRQIVTNGTSGSPAEEAGLIYDDGGDSNRTGIYFFNNFSSAGDSWMSFKTMSNNVVAERARIDSSGNFLIGTTTAVARATVAESVSGGEADLLVWNPSGSSGDRAALYLSAVASTPNLSRSAAIKAVIGTQNNHSLLFFTNDAFADPVERARITSAGEFLVGKSSASVSSGVGVMLLPDGRTFDTITNSDNTLHVWSTTASAYRFYVSGGGTINATSTTITAISDQRLKENIQDIDVGLGAVMALKPRKFDWKAGKGKDKKGDRGWIAQEFEQVFPDMIQEWLDPAPEGEEPYKAVNADLIPVLVKAIQEQQAIIEQLKADVAALKGA